MFFCTIGQEHPSYASVAATSPSKLFLYNFATDLRQCCTCELTTMLTSFTPRPEEGLVIGHQASCDLKENLLNQPQHLILPLP